MEQISSDAIIKKIVAILDFFKTLLIKLKRWWFLKQQPLTTLKYSDDL